MAHIRHTRTDTVQAYKPMPPSKSVYQPFIPSRAKEDMAKCRRLLNHHYITDYFSPGRDADFPERPAHLKPVINPRDTKELRRVRSLREPYWALTPAGRRAVENPAEFTRRYGEGPHPRPWLPHHENADPGTLPSARIVNTGRHVDLCPLKLVDNQFRPAWNDDTEITSNSRCETSCWSCRLLHMKSINDCPWRTS